MKYFSSTATLLWFIKSLFVICPVMCFEMKLASIRSKNSTFTHKKILLRLNMQIFLSFTVQSPCFFLLKVENKFDRLRRTLRASPWVSPMPSPSVNSVRQRFTPLARVRSNISCLLCFRNSIISRAVTVFQQKRPEQGIAYQSSTQKMFFFFFLILINNCFVLL